MPVILPRVQAMVLCDDIEESEQDADAMNLVGVRSVLVSPVFPLVRSLLCVFIQMSGHPGQASCHVEIESLGGDGVIFETDPLTFSFMDPTVVVPVILWLPNCVFSTAGVYYVQVYCDEKLIGERPLTVRQED